MRITWDKQFQTADNTGSTWVFNKMNYMYDEHKKKK